MTLSHRKSSQEPFNIARVGCAGLRFAQQLSHVGVVVEEARLPPLDFDPALLRMVTGASQPEENQSPPTLAQYLAALDRRDQSIMAWERFFQAWDVLVCPPCMTTAFPHCEPGSPLQVNGQDVEYWLVGAHTTVFNYTGHPAIVLPYTLDGDGLPIGVQLVGKRWDESRLLGIAKALTDVTGEFPRPPGY